MACPSHGAHTSGVTRARAKPRKHIKRATVPTTLLLIFPFPASAGSPGCGEPRGRFSCLGSKGTPDVALPLLSNIYHSGNKRTWFWVPCRGWCHVLAAGRGVPAVPHGTAPYSAPAQSHRDGIAPAPSSARRSEVTWGCVVTPCPASVSLQDCPRSCLHPRPLPARRTPLPKGLQSLHPTTVGRCRDGT